MSLTKPGASNVPALAEPEGNTGEFEGHYAARAVAACGVRVPRMIESAVVPHWRHCWACSSSSVVLGSPKEAATTLTIDGTSHVHGYDCTVASAACDTARRRAQWYRSKQLIGA